MKKDFSIYDKMVKADSYVCHACSIMKLYGKKDDLKRHQREEHGKLKGLTAKLKELI
jgi:hypothetical protein